MQTTLFCGTPVLVLGPGGRWKGSDCPADINGACAVDVSDLLILLANWG